MRRLIANMKGTIFINAAILVESNMLYLCNNNVIMVKCPSYLRWHRLTERGLNKEQIDQRNSAQLSDEERRDKILEQIVKDGCGKLIEVESSGPLQNTVYTVFNKIFGS